MPPVKHEVFRIKRAIFENAVNKTILKFFILARSDLTFKNYSRNVPISTVSVGRRPIGRNSLLLRRLRFYRVCRVSRNQMLTIRSVNR